MKFYDISRFRFDSEMEDKKVIQKEKERRKSAIDFIVKYDPITKIIFIKEINCVFLSQESSKMKFVTSPFNKISTKENNHLLIEFCYSKDETGPLEAISYNNELKQLYTGDRIGNIKCYDISMIYDIMEMIDGYSSFTSDKMDIINTKTGQCLKTEPFIELHDAVCDFIKYE